MRRAFWSPRVWIRRLGWKLIELTDPVRTLRPRGDPPAPRNLPPPPIKRIPIAERLVDTVVQQRQEMADTMEALSKNSGAREIPLRRSIPMPVTMTAEERESQRIRRQSGK